MIITPSLSAGFIEKKESGSNYSVMDQDTESDD